MEWIPIEREAPKDGQKILVCYEDGTILGTRYNPRSLSTWLAWMPQPKPYTADTPQTDCSTCKWGEWYRNGRDITNMDDECGGCCSWNNKWQPKEPQTDCPWK